LGNSRTRRFFKNELVTIEAEIRWIILNARKIEIQIIGAIASVFVGRSPPNGDSPSSVSSYKAIARSSLRSIKVFCTVGISNYE